MIIAKNTLQLEPGVRTAVTVGKFDGLHRGHRLLIERIVREKENGLVPVVVSVEDPGFRERLLLPDEEEMILERLGVGCHLHLALDPAVKSMEAETFIKTVLVGMLHASFLALGNDFSFGKDRRGTPELLKKEGERYGFGTEVFRRITAGGEIISSAAVRAAVQAGDVEKASAMLGCPYGVSGEIVHGKGIGRSLGFPTANVSLPSGRVLPRFGVYLSEAELDGSVFPAVTDVGVDPTFGAAKAPALETVFLTEKGDFYGKTVSIRLLRFLRPERRFESEEALKTAIASDVAAAESYFRSRAEDGNLKNVIDN